MRKEPTDEQRRRNNLKRKLARVVRRVIPDAIQTPAQMFQTAELAREYLASGRHTDD